MLHVSASIRKGRFDSGLFKKKFEPKPAGWCMPFVIWINISGRVWNHILIHYSPPPDRWGSFRTIEHINTIKNTPKNTSKYLANIDKVITAAQLNMKLIDHIYNCFLLFLFLLFLVDDASRMTLHLSKWFHSDIMQGHFCSFCCHCG